MPQHAWKTSHKGKQKETKNKTIYSADGVHDKSFNII